MANGTTQVIQRQDPEIEAYRLGLLGDVQQLIRDQVFGQNVQNLREQGLQDQEIAERLNRDIADVGNITADQIFRPADYQVASLTPSETDAIRLAQTGVGAFEPFLTQGQRSLGIGQQAIGSGIAGLAGASREYDPASMADFFTQYDDLAVQATLDDIREQAEKQRPAIGARAANLGAFGARRNLEEAALTDSILREQAITSAKMRGELARDAASRSQQAFEDASRRGIQGSQIVGQLGAGLGSLGVQQAGLGELQSGLSSADIQRLMATGSAERGVTQAGLDAERLSNLQRYSQPFQQFGFLSDVYSGIPTGSSTITTASMPQTSPFQQVAGLGIAGLSAAAGAREAGLF